MYDRRIEFAQEDGDDDTVRYVHDLKVIFTNCCRHVTETEMGMR